MEKNNSKEEDSFEDQSSSSEGTARKSTQFDVKSDWLASDESNALADLCENWRSDDEEEDKDE